MNKLCFSLIAACFLTMEACGQSMSMINGITYLNGHNLGPGNHRINTVQKDGRLFYQVQTTNGSNGSSTQFIPADRGSQGFQANVGSGSSVSNVFISSGGAMPPMPPFNMPKMPNIVMPDIRIPNIVMPEMPKMPDLSNLWNNLNNMFQK